LHGGAIFSGNNTVFACMEPNERMFPSIDLNGGDTTPNGNGFRLDPLKN
jgi:hypothetical protein